ncbi:MAG: P1 family peptidase, partial [Gemmatimonadaceae bacterium]
MQKACRVTHIVARAITRIAAIGLLVCVATTPQVSAQSVSAAVASGRVRARDIGVAPGIFRTGKWNAITDVAGVRVGHATVSVGDSIRTGVTAIIPHSGDLFRDRVPAALHVGNGFGKLLGSTQLAELGELETPI